MGNHAKITKAGLIATESTGYNHHGSRSALKVRTRFFHERTALLCRGTAFSISAERMLHADITGALVKLTHILIGSRRGSESISQIHRRTEGAFSTFIGEAILLFHQK